MAVVSMKQLLEAGVHFGHQTRRWNPKMAPYIYTERNGIYIIDLQKTVKKLEEAYSFVRDLSANGGNVLFVGTKKQAQEAARAEKAAQQTSYEAPEEDPVSAYIAEEEVAQKKVSCQSDEPVSMKKIVLPVIVLGLIIGLVIGLVVTQPWSSGADDTAEATDEATTGIVMMVE